MDTEKWNRLTILGFRVERRGKRKKLVRLAYCRCDCGEEVLIVERAVREGRTQSCGCLRREATAIRNRLRAGRKLLTNPPQTG